MKEWLSGIVGESAANIVGFILIFAIILCGIFVVLSIIRRFSGGTYVSNGRTRQPRLSVMDAAAVDSRRKLVLIRRDDVEHLLLIGGPTDVVVEQNIVMESRAHARAQPSRIEPEHIERFKQHEVLTNEKTPALSLQTPPANEKDEAIQISSAIETPAYRKPEPAREEPAPGCYAGSCSAPGSGCGVTLVAIACRAETRSAGAGSTTTTARAELSTATAHSIAAPPRAGTATVNTRPPGLSIKPGFARSGEFNLLRWCHRYRRCCRYVGRLGKSRQYRS